jgi:signal transduction histidine kinase
MFGAVVRYSIQRSLINDLDQVMSRPAHSMADWISRADPDDMRNPFHRFDRHDEFGHPPDQPGPPPGQADGLGSGNAGSQPNPQNQPPGAQQPDQNGQQPGPGPNGTPQTPFSNATQAPESGGHQIDGRNPDDPDHDRHDFGHNPPPPFGGPGQHNGPHFYGMNGYPTLPFQVQPYDPAALKSAQQGGPPVFTVLKDDKHTYRVMSLPVTKDGRQIGVVQVSRPLDDVYDEVNDVTKTLLKLIPIALLLAGIGGAFLTDLMLRPVRQITHTAERIEAHNLSGRLPVVGNDEFSNLARTFNSMLGRLETSFNQLGQAYEQQKRFTADASHELRTPLTVIKANTSLALAGATTIEEYRSALQEADIAVDRTNKLVMDLLLLARSDSNQIQIQRESVNIHDLFEHTIGTLRTVKSAESNIPSIAMMPFASTLCIDGDYEMLVRLFGNILANAVRHTPATGKIIFGAKIDGESVVLSIKDTGEGIPPEHLAHIGERFYRVDPSRSNMAGGTGLGLAICKSIAEAHNTTLKFESKVGEGTTVSIRLPRTADD